MRRRTSTLRRPALTQAEPLGPFSTITQCAEPFDEKLDDLLRESNATSTPSRTRSTDRSVSVTWRIERFSRHTPSRSSRRRIRFRGCVGEDFIHIYARGLEGARSTILGYFVAGRLRAAGELIVLYDGGRRSRRCAYTKVIPT